MNGYICFWRGKKTGIYAENPLDAQRQAAKVFKAKRDYEVLVVLAEKDGKQVETSTSLI
jgi:hypothetical protein